MTIYPASSASEQLFERVRANIDDVRARIRATDRDLASVRIVAVTKTFGVDEVRAARAAGLTTFGENYVDELCAKRKAADLAGAVWHYLGALQSNKIARASQCADVLCGVAREKELARLAVLTPGKSIDIQVDFTNDPRRNGVSPRDVGSLVALARSLGLRVRGLMVVAPHGESLTRAAFSATTLLADELGIVERSMGMSDDLEIACAFGTTEVRLGRALFGPRVGPGHLA